MINSGDLWHSGRGRSRVLRLHPCLQARCQHGRMEGENGGCKERLQTAITCVGVCSCVGGLSDAASALGRKSSTPCQNHQRPGLATVPWAQTGVKEKREEVEKGKGKVEAQWGGGEDARVVLRTEPPPQCWELLSAGGTGTPKTGLGEV